MNIEQSLQQQFNLQLGDDLKSNTLLKFFGKSCVTLILAFFSMGTAIAATFHTDIIAGVEVDIRKGGKDKYPLVIFSHGFGGCPSGNDEIQENLANRGYTVIAPKHQDCLDETPVKEGEWGEPKEWTEETYSSRRDDISDILAALPYEEKWAQYIDFENIGCMGYSLGGYTCMGLAGAWPSWSNYQIDAFVLLSPWHFPYSVERKKKREDPIEDMHGRAILYMGGSLDNPITWSRDEDGMISQNLKKLFDRTPTHEKYIQIFKGAHHFSFKDKHSFSDEQIQFIEEKAEELGITLDDDWWKPENHRRFHKDMSYYINSFFNAYLGGNKKKLDRCKSDQLQYVQAGSHFQKYCQLSTPETE